MTKSDCEEPLLSKDEAWELDHNEHGGPSYDGMTFGRYSNRARVSEKLGWAVEKREAEEFMHGIRRAAITGVEVLGALLFALWPKGTRGRQEFSGYGRNPA